jgi:hypothetical protein
MIFSSDIFILAFRTGINTQEPGGLSMVFSLNLMDLPWRII